MSRDPIEALARIERHALDRARQTLGAIVTRGEALEADLVRLQAARSREGVAPGADPVLLARYIDRSRARERALSQALAAIEAERQAQAERLTEQRGAVRRLEILVERRTIRAAYQRDRREQRALEDLVLARRCREPVDR